MVDARAPRAQTRARKIQFWTFPPIDARRRRRIERGSAGELPSLKEIKLLLKLERQVET